MRTLTMNEVEEVSGGIVPALIGAAAVIIAALIGSCSSKGTTATAANGATVNCNNGTTATANETTATCR